MENSIYLLIIGMILGFTGIVVGSYHLFYFISNKWEEAQMRTLDLTATKFDKMFIFLDKRTLVFFIFAFSIILGALLYFLTNNILVGVIAAFIGVISPVWIANIMEKHRQKKFIHQLVDGLMILNSSLKGGLTLPQAFEILAEESPSPLSKEIALLNRELKMGVTLEEALTRLERRMPSEEMTLINSAIFVARETGGDLTKVFSGLIDTIRSRIKLRDMVTTLTFQARAQSLIISILGPAFFFLIRRIRPHHFDIMWKDEFGRSLLFVAAFLQVVGIYLVIKFGKIRI